MRLLDIILGWLRPKPPAPAPVPPPGPPAPPGDAAAALLAAVNAARDRAGAGPLAADPGFARTAQGWASALAARGGQPDHGDWLGRLTAVHVGPVSEDVAAGQTTAAEVVADWLADPPHRRSVLDPQYGFGGCGVAAHPGGWTYYVLDLGG